jgi:predicted hydrocarbon binding protein
MTAIDRPTLGGFMSLTCFQFLRVGTEEVADRAPIVASGRKRGYSLVESLGQHGKVQDAAEMQRILAAALGADGTRLCLVQSITSLAPGRYEVRITEGACTAGQTATEPLCAFTMGVFIGALSAFAGTPMKGRETECCACGAAACVYLIESVAL